MTSYYLIPYLFKDTCISHMEEIPYMKLIECENDYKCKIVRKCPCLCDNKIQYFKLKKEDVNEFIETNTNANCDDGERWFVKLRY